ncbi:hypothetical protein F3Y22_tig00111387pilonHSYRG00040 [Hibiscus syriacus]|uniref:RNase H type-1 domain-containing protein n=1 Tax=Hibiscus syriacus TaxID=106335 RepID=A0A6A2YMG8_HIBSY|nr:hypothetical protein F3Y22_tig00111387pilonHSYRG00040 [Hibiscus syriacus]
MNVDVAVIGSGRMTEIDGVLRDHSGVCLVRFSRSIGSSDPTSAKLIAILEASQIMLGLENEYRNMLQIESNSKLVVKWVNNPYLSPPACADLLREELRRTLLGVMEGCRFLGDFQAATCTWIAGEGTAVLVLHRKT